MALQKKPEEEKKRVTQALTELYREVAASLAENPRSERAQGLVTRWMELLDVESDGDPGVKTGSLKTIADRLSWPVWLKRTAARRHQLSFEAYNDNLKFIERALAHSQKPNSR